MNYSSDFNCEAKTHTESDAPDSLIDDLLENSVAPSPKKKIEGLLIGNVVKVDSERKVWVHVPGVVDPPVLAKSIAPLNQMREGAQCALMFENGQSEFPVIMGILQQSVIALGACDSGAVSQSQDRIDIVSDREINLHCGDAHLRLTADGRVEMRGRTVISHSTGLNRIRGASVKLN